MDTRNVDLNLLRALDVLIAERNVTRAALRLNLSQPALSAQLNRLRDIFGDQLLIPAQRGMIPTERALELQVPLRRALEQVRHVVAEHCVFDPMTADVTFAIAASDYMQYTLLVPLTRILQRQAPRVRVAWYPVCGSPVLEQIERGEIHLWLKPSLQETQELRSSTLLHEEFLCIARDGHPLIDGKIDLDTFLACSHAIVSPGGGGFTGPTDLALQRQGLERRVVLSVASFLILPEVIARSDLIALVPERIARSRSHGLQVLQPPLEVQGFDVVMLWHPRTDAHPSFRWLRDQLQDLADT